MEKEKKKKKKDCQYLAKGQYATRTHLRSECPLRRFQKHQGMPFLLPIRWKHRLNTAEQRAH